MINVFHCNVHGKIGPDKIIYSKNGKHVHKRCRECSKERSLKARQGITMEEKTAMFENQNQSCAICFETMEESKMYIDHIHGTKIIRGLLCRDCNISIGNFKDNLEILKKAKEYLCEDFSFR